VALCLVFGDEIKDRLLWLRKSAHGGNILHSSVLCNIVSRETLSNAETKTGRVFGLPFPSGRI
jgi:hypothetical protein